MPVERSRIDSFLQIGTSALLSTIATTIYLYVAGGGYFTGNLQTQGTLSGSNLATVSYGQSYVKGNLAVGTTAPTRGERFYISGSGSITGTQSGSTAKLGGGITTINRDVVTKSLLSGSQLWLNGGGTGKVLCTKSTGQVGTCNPATIVASVCSCN